MLDLNQSEGSGVRASWAFAIVVLESVSSYDSR